MSTRHTRWSWLMVVMSAASLSALGNDIPLIKAVKDADRDAVRLLLKRPGVVNSPEADGTTALHWAARAEDSETVLLLLHAGANANAVNRYGVTPLALAALNGSAPVVDALLAAGADPNIRLADDQTILMAAARSGNPDVVKALLTHGAEVNARERVLGETALVYAAIENHAEVVRVLAHYGADLNARSDVTSFPMFTFGDGVVARETTLPRGGWTALMYAGRQGAVDAAKALVATGADLNVTDPDGTTALVLAIINAHFDLAGVLIEAGADPDVPDSTGMTALYAAVDMHTLPETVGRPNPKPNDTLDSPGVIKALLAHGANPNVRLKTPILNRVHNDGNSDASLSDGATPLMRAAKQADVIAMQLLLDNGGDPNIVTAKGMTSLMYAAGRLSGFRGALNLSSPKDAMDAIALCLRRGANINATDTAGQTALHYAAAAAEESVVDFLVAKGANPLAVDKGERTPLDVALKNSGRGGQISDVAAGESKMALLRQLTRSAAETVRRSEP